MKTIFLLTWYIIQKKRKMCEDNCAICLEKLTGDIRIIPCGHKFHTSCYGNWANQSSGNITTCPCCRAENPDPEYTSTPRRRTTRHYQRTYVRPRDLENNFVEELFRSMHGGLGLEEVIRNRMQPNNTQVVHEMNTQEAIALMLGLFILLGIVYTFITVHKTCICNVRWNPGETTRTETYLFGSATYNRPDVCTYVC